MKIKVVTSAAFGVDRLIMAEEEEEAERRTNGWFGHFLPESLAIHLFVYEVSLHWVEKLPVILRVIVGCH